MRDALANTDRDVVYSICEWGVQDPARWAGFVGNSWRISYVSPAYVVCNTHSIY